MAADLHLHTIFSDGTKTPEEIVEKAIAAKLRVIAISDHDEVEGIRRAKAAAARASQNGNVLEIIPAIELNAEISHNEVHILGYHVDWEANWFREILISLQARRKQRVNAMIEKLQALGVSINLADILPHVTGNSLGRPHVAKALVALGVVPTFQEAFNQYLAYGKPAYVKGNRLSAQEAIDLIHQAGGVAVLAHPGVYRPPLDAETIIPLGLDGIEVFYARHTPLQVEQYQALCEKYNLVMTGGSDYHGENQPDRTFGSIQLDDTVIHALEARKASRITRTPS